MEKKRIWKYIRVPFSESEKEIVQEIAKENGMRVNEYIRRCILLENHLGFLTDTRNFERHTAAIDACRKEINRLFFSDIEDKILLNDTIRNLHQRHCRIESEEALLRKELRIIRLNLLGLPVEDEDGEGSGDVQT